VHSVLIAAAVVATQPGGMTVGRTWIQAAIPNQRTDNLHSSSDSGLPLIVLPSIYSSHILLAHNSFEIVTRHHGLEHVTYWKGIPLSQGLAFTNVSEAPATYMSSLPSGGQ